MTERWRSSDPRPEPGFRSDGTRALPRLGLVSFAVLALAFASACRRAPSSAEEGGDAPLRLVVITHGQAADPFWSVVKRGVEDAAREVGARVDYRAPETFDVVQMARLVDAAVASAPDGLALSVPDPDALAEPVERALGAGIPVISFNSGRAHRERLRIPLHVGQDEREAGRRAGARLRDRGIRRALCVNHEVGNVALDRRCEGLGEGLGHAVDVVAVDLDPTRTRSRILATLETSPDVEAILTLGPTVAEPTLAALIQAERTDVVLGTFDLSPAVLDAIEAGRIAFALDQQQYLQGYLPVVLLARRVRAGVLPSADILTGPGFVTAEDAARVRAFSQAGLR